MINLHEYELIKEENGILRMVVVSVPCCPDCGDKMRVRDSRIRCFIKEDGQKCLLRHRRLRCAKCKKIHSELPDFIMPEKRYVADVILGLFFSDTSDQSQQICAVAENSTFYKWEIEITYRMWVFFLFLQNCCTTFMSGNIMSIIIKILNCILNQIWNQFKNRYVEQKQRRKILIWLYCFEPEIYFM